MRLVYDVKIGREWKPVTIGDEIVLGKDDPMTTRTVIVTDIIKPHKPDSTGRVEVRDAGGVETMMYYPGIIGAHWIEREDRGWRPKVNEQGDRVNIYRWNVGDYAALKVFVLDEENTIIPAGTVIRLVRFPPKVTMPDRESERTDMKPYFYNACRIGIRAYPMIRQDFCTIRRPTTLELYTALKEVEALYLATKLVAHMSKNPPETALLKGPSADATYGG